MPINCITSRPSHPLIHRWLMCQSFSKPGSPRVTFSGPVAFAWVWHFASSLSVSGSAWPVLPNEKNFHYRAESVAQRWSNAVYQCPMWAAMPVWRTPWLYLAPAFQTTCPWERQWLLAKPPPRHRQSKCARCIMILQQARASFGLMPGQRLRRWPGIRPKQA